MDLLDCFRGCLLGGAVGDALGMPTEGYTAEEIRSHFGPVREMLAAPVGHFHTGLEAGQFTDDTEETLLLAESLIEASGFSAERFAGKLIEWGTAWTLDERLNRGVGFTTHSSVESLIAGRSWQESGLSIPTCGSAMRASPIGLLFHSDIGLTGRYADLQSLPTHTASAARAGSVAVATGVALCLQGFPHEMILQTAAEKARLIDRDFAEKLFSIESLLDLEPYEALKTIGTSPLASETVPAAFYCFLKLGPEEALMIAAGGGGDTDSIASIAGSLFGAACGPGWIPDRWLSLLEQKERIEAAARGLFDLQTVLSR
ncbi:MAG TPA: ADP-ribosylglycohydrolase family protein [Methanothrix sp.]|nr:ADP-ribosylglycohydrolase family protein [Methanothrix sp.]